MRLIAPIDIDLASSSIGIYSDGYPEYSSGTTYAAGAIVAVCFAADGTTPITPHKLYYSLAAGNIGEYPPSHPDKWQDQGGTSRWKMFDEFVDTQSSDADLIEVVVSCDNCDYVALFNLDATNINLSQEDVDTSTEVLLVNHSLLNDDGSCKTVLIAPIKIYANSSITITINNIGGQAKCGICLLGLSADIGAALWEQKPGIIDYSIKDVNDYGHTYLSIGAWAKELSPSVLIQIESADAIFEDLTSRRGTLSIFDINADDTGFEPLQIYGFIKNWDITFLYPDYVRLDMDIQGVI
jgi:hypothetical protein